MVITYHNSLYRPITIIIRCKVTYFRIHTLMVRVDEGRVSDLRMVTLGVGGAVIDNSCLSALSASMHNSNAIKQINSQLDNNFN